MKRAKFVQVFLMIVVAALPLAAVQLNVARTGVVANVPLEAPYNGCLVVREGPGFEHAVKGHVVNGTSVTIDSGQGSWYRITAPMTGYVWASYVKITDAETVNTENMSQALSLNDIVRNADPWKRDKNLQQRRELEENSGLLPIPGVDQQP